MNKHNNDELDFREKLASIDRQLAEHDRTRQEIKYEPWKVLISGLSAGMGLLLVALTMLKVFGVISFV